MLIFISYASEDFERVLPYYEFLHDKGLDVWIDKKRLVGGQNWDLEIKKALNKATMIVIFVSENSYDKRGYIQRELKLALKKIEEKLYDDIYIIPVLMSPEVKRPEELSEIQFIDGDSLDSKDRVFEAINLQLIKMGAKEERLVEEQDIRYSIISIKEGWEGCPGYEFVGDKISLFSRTHIDIDNISEIINYDAIMALVSLREVKFEQSPQDYHFGMSRFSRMNSFDRKFSSLDSNGRILSIRFTDFIYNAGAAHHIYGTKCYNFTLSPITYLPSLSFLFESPDDVFKIIQNETRIILNKKLNPDALEFDDWIINGTKNWSDFSNFYFTDEDIQFDFPPYQVASFADGVQTIMIKRELLLDYFKPIYAEMLKVGWI